ncbi:MAG: transglutaminase family protein [Alphaproteobacteria bacterium]|nr:transglutaminase family protein [Alphaproteobacteria bacterium]
MTAGAAAAILRGLADRGDMEVDLGEGALALAALERPRVPLDRYRAHLAELAADVGARAGVDPDLDRQAAALSDVIAGTHGYQGDVRNYDDLQNANLMRVIDRRRGLPVALGILYLHAAQSLGWEATGLAFPAHFVIALAAGQSRAILDPFHGGVRRGAAELRRLLKSVAGENEELGPAHYAPVGNRAVLLRLHNNVKLRRIQGRDVAGALAAIDAMLLFAPREAGLWHEAGLLNGHLGNLRAAVGALERALALAGDATSRHRLAALIQDLRARLN